MFTIRIIHEHRLNPEGVRLLMTISTEFQAQVDRLKAFVASLEGGPTAQSAEDTAAVKAALDAAGAPPAVDPNAPPPTA